MKKVLLGLALMTSLLSCKKNVDSEIESDAETQSLKKTTHRTSAGGDGVWDVMGYGYDITGQYASSESTTYPVIDIARYKADYPTYVDVSGAETGTHFAASGQNAEEFSIDLKNNTTLSGGTNMLFKGTIDFNFSDTNKWSSKYIYATYSSIAIKKRLKMITVDIPLIKNYLHQGFLDHVNSLSAANLVALYGTHVLTDIKVGGKLELIYKAETTSTSRKISAHAGAQVSFTKIFGLNTSGDYNQTDAQNNFNETAFVRTVGGNSGAAIVNTVTFNSAGTPSFTFNPAAWSAGVTDSNAELLDIPAGGLLSISELIDDPAKKAAVENYIAQYLIDNKVIVTPEPIYQFYASVGDHFTSINPNATVNFSGWRSDGIDFKAFKSQVAGTLPVYQFYNGPATDHFISINPNAVTGLNNWQNYGVEFYAYPTQVAGTIPIYEYWYSGGSDHFVTTNPNITQYPGWVSHGIVFYAFPK